MLTRSMAKAPEKNQNQNKRKNNEVKKTGK